jgi:hypothetical protein
MSHFLLRVSSSTVLLDLDFANTATGANDTSMYVPSDGSSWRRETIGNPDVHNL